MSTFLPQLTALMQAANYRLSDVLPSVWAEENRSMTSEVSRFEGRFSYNITPYLREIVDTLHPAHPARKVAIMKGAQIGFSTGVIESGLGYIISQNPGPTLFLTGHADLTEEAMTGKVDQMIDSCGLRKLIKPNTLRKKSQRTGDTNSRKEFAGGYIIGGHANHKTLRQRSVKYGFIDDFEAMPNNSKESGSTTRMIEQRFAAYGDVMKLYYISTPEVEETSNIKPVYLMGDQRKWHVPCPCCGEMIALEWDVAILGDEKERGGIYWELDENNELIEGSVGYVCQMCGDWFDDSLKYDLNLAGQWMPTAKPIHEGYYSYHLSSLYAPPGMYNWVHYVRQYLGAYPPGADAKENEVQTFMNLCLGETYKPMGKTISGHELERNCRDYAPVKWDEQGNYVGGTVPDSVSIKDGNGKIVMITIAVDANGLPDDARLDYEVVAWSENGSSYSVSHGSVGTFVPREGAIVHKTERARWTYDHGKENSVWPVLQKIFDTHFVFDTARQPMKAWIKGVDMGYHKMEAQGWQFIDMQQKNANVIGLKGSGDSQPLRMGADLPRFKPSRERGEKLMMVESNMLKDDLADLIALKWDAKVDERQPHGFMNFPSDSHQYRHVNFFSHFEAEERVLDTNSTHNAKWKWQKKNTAVQNHLFDCRYYNLALRDIFVWQLRKELGMPKPDWNDFVNKVIRK